MRVGRWVRSVPPSGDRAGGNREVCGSGAAKTARARHLGRYRGKMQSASSASAPAAAPPSPEALRATPRGASLPALPIAREHDAAPADLNPSDAGLWRCWAQARAACGTWSCMITGGFTLGERSRSRFSLTQETTDSSWSQVHSAQRRAIDPCSRDVGAVCSGLGSRISWGTSENPNASTCRHMNKLAVCRSSLQFIQLRRLAPSASIPPFSCPVQIVPAPPAASHETKEILPLT